MTGAAVGNNELQATAHHEAGHAVAAWHGKWPIALVTIKRCRDFDPPALGHIAWDETGTFDERWAGMIGACGALAESHYTGRPVEYPKIDCGIALRHLIEIGVTDYRTAGDALEVEAKMFLERHWHQVTAVAAELLRRETITGADIDKLLSSRLGGRAK